uniref:WAT1-related protein n=1 Tax=Salix viminalis TaxID=40686 RepID=A0A6N2LGE3_SALVM
MGAKSFLLNSLPFAAMVMVECLDVGLTTLSKAAMSKGMSRFVFVVYSNALATLILLPCLIFHRAKRPPVTFSLLWKFFLLSLVGITLMQNCVFAGVSYSSPTLASAMGQLIPAFTFLLAVIFRMEKLDWRCSRNWIKIMGTLLSISGALIITLYKGPAVGAIATPSNLVPTPSIMATTNTWVIGGLFLVTADLCISISTTFQAAVLKECPSEMVMVFFFCFFGTIQTSIVSLIAERNTSAWKLRPDIELISIIYSAVVGGAVTFGVVAWCIHKKGPFFVAMFKPVGIAAAAFLGVSFLGDTLHVGCIVGAIIIVAGFYGVIWAQSKENEHGEVKKPRNLQSMSQKTPLLESHMIA